MNADEAIRRAIDPYGPDGEQVTASAPTPSEVVRRLAENNYQIVKINQFLEAEPAPEPEGVQGPASVRLEVVADDGTEVTWVVDNYDTFEGALEHAEQMVEAEYHRTGVPAERLDA